MLFLPCFFHVAKSNAIYFALIGNGLFITLYLPCQAKRKQAMLESNLSGLTLMFDKNVYPR